MGKQNTFFDIIISGGGLSGSLMALSLADLKKNDGSLLSIAIVETAIPESNDNGNNSTLFDDRVLALSHGSSSYLNALNVWQHLANDACAIEKIDISDKGYYGKARLEAQKQGVSALGYVIEMALIGKAQLKELATKNNVTWFCPNKITAINWQADNQGYDQVKDQTSNHPSAQNKTIEVTLNSTECIQTSLLLGCDGANSPCRQLAGIQSHFSDYNQVALIANVATKKPHQNKAFERFTQFGPLAMLPLTALNSSVNVAENNDGRCSLVWTMTPEQSQKMLNLSDDEFKLALESAFGSWLGGISHVGKRDAYPLVLMQAQQQTFHRMALIGNASHTIHPIAGQGFNLGLRDVQQLSALINKSLQEDKDLGRFSLLNEYARMRQVDQFQVIQLTDSLVTLFSNDLCPLIAGRSIGLKVLNYISPLKSTVVNKLMGY